MTDKLSCRVTRFYNPYTKWIIVLLIGGYSAVCFYYFTHFSDPIRQMIMGHPPFIIFLFTGFAAIFFIPMFLSLTKSYLIFSKDEVIEHRGYISGLFKIPELRMQWSDFKSWEADFTNSRGSKKKSYYIELFPKNQHSIFILDDGRYWQNDTEIKWKAFEQHFKALVKEVGLPDRMKDWEEIIQDDIDEQK